MWVCLYENTLKPSDYQEGHFIVIKGTTPQDDTQLKTALKYMKEKLTELKGEKTNLQSLFKGKQKPFYGSLSQHAQVLLLINNKLE